MKELSLAIDNFLLRIFEAIEKDDSMALESLIKNNKKLSRVAASEKHLVLEAFKRNAQKCMKALLDNLEFESKEEQVKAVEKYIIKRLSKFPQELSESELDCVQLLNSTSVEDKIFERKANQVEPSEHVVYFRAFLRSKALTPIDYLPLAHTEREKKLCLTLLT
ncbi:hypothetical protein WE348_08910 [Alteromonas macleodii]|uniref:hypothetical protein n=1 Tax=Alteromonas macleodii TaxID=28108 RepID=UPI000C8AF47A|nr:hypothetical protein [Idiomarinaceae bacterium]